MAIPIMPWVNIPTANGISTSAQTLSFSAAAYSLLRITDAKGDVVINIDGNAELTFGPGFTTTDNAVKLFWESMQAYVAPTMLLNNYLQVINKTVDILKGLKAP